MPPLVVHNRREAEAALAGAKAPILISAPDAAHYAGLSYLKEMMTLAAAPVFYVDCGGDAALVIAALRSGFKHIACAVEAGELHRLREIAQAHDAVIDLSSQLL